MLARKNLNWSATNTRLYNEAFTGRAKALPRFQHCLSEDHGAQVCPHNPHPPYMGWLAPAYPLNLQPAIQPGPSAQPAPLPGAGQGANTRNEICRGFNDSRCRFPRCRFAHICSECFGPHLASSCPCRGAPLALRGRQPNRLRQNQPRPYPQTRQ